ncbi:hypothetical protein ASD02_33380 [Ensifer sp. Root1252]|nr:hypothetical protein ASD02_33380 [Ensifer sp. Root1252]KRC72887.1 hypothetical protein ASE32_33070 [Ensifer sp. Root231]KRC94120.1 hypothetical protein ASE47_34235 [Ensifer sp. Root258]
MAFLLLCPMSGASTREDRLFDDRQRPVEFLAGDQRISRRTMRWRKLPLILLIEVTSKIIQL